MPLDQSDHRSRLASLIDSADDAAFGWDDDDRIVAWSAAAERHLGVGRDGALGKYRREVLPPSFESAVLHRMPRLERGERIPPFEIELEPGAGPAGPFLVQVFPLRDSLGTRVGSGCLARPASGPRADAGRDRAVRDREDRLNLTMAASGMGVWEWDLASGAVELSAPLEAIHGYATGGFGGRFEDFRLDVHPDDLEAVRTKLEQAVAHRAPYRMRHRIVRPDGGVVWIEASGRVFTNASGQPERVVAICSDVNERQRDESTLRDAARRKDEFLSILGHELRNPLAPIHNCIQILRSRPSPEDRAEVWSMLERQVANLGALVDDLLDVSRIASGKILLRKDRLDLVDLVRAAVADHRSSLEAHGLTLDVRVPDRPLWIRGDRTRLGQALGHLLHNAGKFTQRNGVVTVDAYESEGSGVVGVRDTGIGMPADLVARLFEPFVQAPHGIDRPQGGLGLGLTLVKSLVELHGGSIEATSPGIGQGSAFTLRLPLKSEALNAPVDSSALEGHTRVLVVEDNDDAATSMRLLLELGGHEVRTASDGAAGIAIARTFHPQVVLCDIGLPGPLDGYAVARALTEDPRLRLTYRVALTGYGQVEDVQRSRAAGFHVHLTKPIVYSDLQRVLDEARSLAEA